MPATQTCPQQRLPGIPRHRKSSFVNGATGLLDGIV